MTFPIVVAAATALLMLLPFRFLRPARAEPRPTGDATPRTPVLVELFTSEGCSDCPPADALLEKLDRSQPVGSAQLIVLSEHVDYWNDIGWKDPYSSHQFSIRQEDYARLFHLSGPYTPQMVVDGDAQFVGSDERRAMQVVEDAAKFPKLPVNLSSLRLDGASSLMMHVEVGPPLSSAGRASGQVLIALADDNDQSSVRGGENAGRILRHVAVLRSLTQVGVLDRAGTFSKDVRVNTGSANPRGLRAVAIVQESIAGKVLGVGFAKLSN